MVKFDFANACINDLSPHISLLSLETNEVEVGDQMMLMQELLWKAQRTGRANILKKNHTGDL